VVLTSEVYAIKQMGKKSSKAAVKSTKNVELSGERVGSNTVQAHEANAPSDISRKINRDIVLEMIRARQPIARMDLARFSGLQRSTISAIVEQLLEERWIKEGALVKTARGRRPTHISLNDELVILVADIRPTRAILAVVDLNARLLSREVVPLISDPSQGVMAMIAAMQRLRSDHQGKTFEGIGICLPGRVDTETQCLILAPNLKWTNFDIKAIVEEKMQLQVELDNAANACLLSEHWFGRMNGVRNAVLITISEGLGAAILVDGHLVTGMNGLAGEFGHIPLDPSGPRCACGLAGCWEMFASSRAALRYYDELKPKIPSTTIQDLLNRAAGNEPMALKALDRQAKYIGQGLRLVTAALSPEAILFAGDITACWERSGPLIEEEIKSRMLAGKAPQLILIGDGELARLRGAAAIVLQRHSRYHSRRGQFRRVDIRQNAQGA
jgi:predicted NBD/HSP70 family sugar kinase